MQRRVLFRWMSLGLGLGLIGLAELSLRLWGVAPEPEWSPRQLVHVVENGAIQGELEWREQSVQPHFVETRDDAGRIWVETDPLYSQGKGAGFPAGGSMRPLRFLAEKPAGIERYALLGGSAALGQNPVGGSGTQSWETEQLGNQVRVLPEQLSISGQLRRRLEAQGRRVEVLNAGMIAQDSASVRDIAEELLPYELDGLLLYLGNNEGIGLSWGMRGMEVPQFEQTRSLLRELRLYRSLADWIVPAHQHLVAQRSLEVEGLRPEVLGKISRAQWQSAGEPLMQGARPVDEVYEALLQRLDGNLRAIVAAAQEQGTEVYILPTPPHLGYEPFFDSYDPRVSESQRLDQKDLRDEARQYLRQGQWEQARAQAQAAVELDPARARCWWLLGRALNGLGRYEEAMEALLQAHALDLSRKRSHPAFFEVSEAICLERGCRSASTHAGLLQAGRERGLQAYEALLGDHEHLTPDGNDWIASIFEQLLSAPASP